MNKLQKQIQQMIQKGIQIDQPQLTKDMCAQFNDPKEYCREFVVNAKDAGATFCQISGYESADTMTIIITDDGHGMNKDRLLGFFTIFKSIKIGDPTKMVGRHGIGKLSVAAIPGQIGFKLITSTGDEAWKAETGSLLKNNPITLYSVDPAPTHGTTFEITFKKQTTLANELNELKKILEHYVKYLDLRIEILKPYQKQNLTGDISENLHEIIRIREPWTCRNDLSMSYPIESNKNHFEIVIGIGKQFTEIYQNRVLITNAYSFYEKNPDEDKSIPYLNIRVDSPDFELPFGRHKLSNEEILIPVRKKLCEELIPDFVSHILDNAETIIKQECGVTKEMLEELSVAMMKFYPGIKSSWSNYRLFKEFHEGTISLAELEEMVTACGKIFIEDERIDGLDYSVLEGPILFNDQPKDAIDFIKEYFKRELIDLSEEDCVFEAPPGICPMRDGRERRFEEFLGFFPDSWIEETRKKIDDEKSHNTGTASEEKSKMLEGVFKNINNAVEELRKMVWKTMYFVEKDFKTPCTRLKFIYKNNVITLNLFHPEINLFLNLSEKSPALAAHWAMSMCLSEENKALKHFTPESRETLLYIDALSKVGKLNPAELKRQINKGFNGLLRNFNNNLNN
jgi:hypothetical protein